MTLPTYEPRCQGAIGGYGVPVAHGAMPADCCQCQRRTQIVPGAPYTYLKPTPTWRPWQDCPKRVAPPAAVPAGDAP